MPLEPYVEVHPFKQHSVPLCCAWLTWVFDGMLEGDTTLSHACVVWSLQDMQGRYGMIKEAVPQTKAPPKATAAAAPAAVTLAPSSTVPKAAAVTVRSDIQGIHIA